MNSVRHLQVTRKAAKLDALKQKTAEEITKSGAEHAPMAGLTPCRTWIAMILQHATYGVYE